MIFNIKGENYCYIVDNSLEIEYLENEAIVYSPNKELVLLLNSTGVKIYNYFISLYIDDIVIYEDIAQYLIKELEIADISENLLKEVINDVEQVAKELIENGFFIIRTQ